VISRGQALDAIDGEQFDVVVIGGGITGAGVALDAASRGYSVALLERGDFAQGTSSRSSKMVHGGLRYLQNFDLGLVREALLERQLMVHLAPHLVYPTPYLVPTLPEGSRNRGIGIGLNMYDVMATSRIGRGRSQREEHEHEGEFWSPDRHRTISGEEAAELSPALAPLEPKSAYLFYDCQTDDARLVLTIMGEAERYGAVLLNGAEVTEILDDGGRASGVAFTEAESGERVEVRATNVVNATGVWADRIRPDEILTEEEIPRIAPSRGTHITLSTDDLPTATSTTCPRARTTSHICSTPPTTTWTWI
jgi:glycerol-3-phosphate dehydrogenase